MKRYIEENLVNNKALLLSHKKSQFGLSKPKPHKLPRQEKEASSDCLYEKFASPTLSRPALLGQKDPKKLPKSLNNVFLRSSFTKATVKQVSHVTL